MMKNPVQISMLFFWRQLPVELLKAGLHYFVSQMWKRCVINGLEIKQKNQYDNKILKLTHSEKRFFRNYTFLLS
jgi:hypothetical protein